MVSNDKRYVEGALSKLVDFVRLDPAVRIALRITRSSCCEVCDSLSLADTMSRRTERLASTIQQELATMIMRDLNDPRLTEHRPASRG